MTEQVAVPTREELIHSCQGLVRHLAWEVHSRLAGHADFDDLIGYGQIGLAEAARDYDPARGQFSTFAYYRIRGAIYDGLSKMAWFGRARFRRQRYEQRASEVLAAEEDRPNDATAADDGEWLHRLANRLAVTYLGAMGEDSSSADVADPHTPEASQIVEGRELQGLLRQLVDSLPADAANLIRGAYFEGLTLQEAGKKIGISKAWASRLHARTLDRLARALKQRNVDESNSG